MPNSPHLDGGAPARRLTRATEPSDWWEFEVALLLGQVHLTEIELSTPAAQPNGAHSGGPNVPHLT